MCHTCIVVIILFDRTAKIQGEGYWRVNAVHLLYGGGT